MFITFEGIDLSGKSTQVKLLVKYLNQRKKRVVVVREPGGTKVSEKIRRILLDKDHGSMDDTAEFLLFSASRRQLTGDVILPELRNGAWVISDRYFDSSTAYQGYGGGLDLRFISSVNTKASHGLMPDLTFLINIDIDCWVRRKKLRLKSEDRIESKKVDYHKRVIDGYLKIAGLNKKRFEIIDGSQAIPDVHKSIVSILESRKIKKSNNQ